MTAAPEPALFDAAARALAAEHVAESAYRWLTLSRDTDARALRAALEHCWSLAGSSQRVLAKGLAHERWGQHVGALAHLLALGLFAHEGLDVDAEPDLGGQSPDLLANSGPARVLVEVRAMTGCGLLPWERDDPLHETTPEELAAALDPEQQQQDDDLPPPARARGTPAAGHAPRTNPAGRSDHERDGRARARRAAIERAAAEQAVQRDLRRSVARVIEKKADAYRALCDAQDLPYIVCLYQDTDRSLGGLVREWAHGRPGPGDPQGAFVHGGERLAHVSALVVFGREEGGAELRLRGEIVLHPGARRPLPAAIRLPDLARSTGPDDAPPPFPIVPIE